MNQFKTLLRDLLITGEPRFTRSGETLSLFGRSLYFPDTASKFPAVTIKKLHFSSVAGELAGFLRAETDARKMGSNIWMKDTERWYRESAFSNSAYDMGRVYGVQWRQWSYGGTSQYDIDQLSDVADLIRRDPASRRLFVSAWNPAEEELMCLPPCHTNFQFYVRKHEFLDLTFNMRSVDVFLGLPFNIASYALLQHIMASETRLKPGRLYATLGDAHLYTNHIDQAKEALGREPYPSPRLKLRSPTTINNFTTSMAELIDYKHHANIEAPLNVG